MKSYNKYSLSTQLVLVLLLVFVSANIMLGVYDYYREIENAKAANLKHIQAIAQSISVAVTEDIYTDNYVHIEQKFTALSELREIDSITLIDVNGMIISDMARNNEKLMPTYNYDLSIEQPEKEFVSYNDDNSLVSINPVYFSGSLIAWLKIKSSPEIIDQAIGDFFSDLVILTVVMLLLVSVTIVLFMRERLKSLQYLVDFAKLLPQAKGAIIKDVNAPPEIKSLMKSLSWASRQIHQQNKELMQQNWTLEQRVAERTMAQEKAMHKAEEASEAKSRFLSQMSHELRTPLNAIMGFSQLMMMDKELLTAEQQGSMDEIYGASRHLLALVNEILEISRIESGKYEVKIERHDVVSIINDVASLLKPLADERDISINYANASCEIISDVMRTKQVLLNVVSNAIKYNKPDGSVDIQVSQNIENTIIKIHDTGEGIVKDDLDRIFESFERSPSSHVVEGAGIGLAISRQLMEAMGGKILVESEQGSGSTFMLVFETAVNKGVVAESG